MTRGFQDGQVSGNRLAHMQSPQGPLGRDCYVRNRVHCGRRREPSTEVVLLCQAWWFAECVGGEEAETESLTGGW